jgi:hypothetical protein
MPNQPKPWMSSETRGTDLPRDPTAKTGRPALSDFSDPDVQDRSTRSLLILMGHEHAQNGSE